jgi:hypothetical protein
MALMLFGLDSEYGELTSVLLHKTGAAEGADGLPCATGTLARTS